MPIWPRLPTESVGHTLVRVEVYGSIGIRVLCASSSKSLDPSNGLLTIDLLLGDSRRTPAAGVDVASFKEAEKELTVLCFVDWDSGLVSVTAKDPVPFSSVAYYPSYDKEDVMPAPEVTCQTGTGFGEFFRTQRLPSTPPTAEVPDPPPSATTGILPCTAGLQGHGKFRSRIQSPCAALGGGTRRAPRVA